VKILFDDSRFLLRRSHFNELCSSSWTGIIHIRCPFILFFCHIMAEPGPAELSRPVSCRVFVYLHFVQRTIPKFRWCY
jgi:hypothetical protein